MALKGGWGGINALILDGLHQKGPEIRLTTDFYGANILLVGWQSMGITALVALIAAVSPLVAPAIWGEGWRVISLAILTGALAAAGRHAGRPAITPEFESNRPFPIELILVLLLVVSAAALRLWKLADIPAGLWVDEAIQGLQGTSLWSGDKLPDRPDFPYPTWPLWWILEGASTKLFGVSVLAIRLPAAIIGILSVPLAWFVGRSLFGVVGGAAAAILLGASFWHTLLSRMALDAVLLPVWGLLTAWLLLAPGVNRRPWAPALAGAVCGLACYGYAAALYLPVWGTFTVFLAWHKAPRPEKRDYAKIAALFLGVLFITAGPFISSLGSRASRPMALAVSAGGPGFGTATLACLTNLMAPVAGGQGWWQGCPTGAAQLSVVEVFVFLLGLVALAVGRVPGLSTVRWAVLSMVPFSLLPEIISGQGPHLARAFGMLAPLALVGGAGASAMFPRILPVLVLPLVVFIGSVDFHLTARRLSGPLAMAPDQKAFFLSVGRDTGNELVKLAREKPLAMVDQPGYVMDPILAFLLWSEVKSGRITPAPALPTPPRLLKIIRDPVRGGPVVFLLVSPRWPRERVLASVSADALLRPGEDMERRGNMAGAESHYRAVLRLVPDLGRAHFRLGAVLMRANRRAEGLRELDAAAKLGFAGDMVSPPGQAKN